MKSNFSHAPGREHTEFSKLYDHTGGNLARMICLKDHHIELLTFNTLKSIFWFKKCHKTIIIATTRERKIRVKT